MNRINSLPNLITPIRLPKAWTPLTPGEVLDNVAGRYGAMVEQLNTDLTLGLVMDEVAAVRGLLDFSLPYVGAYFTRVAYILDNPRTIEMVHSVLDELRDEIMPRLEDSVGLKAGWDFLRIQIAALPPV